MRREKKREKEKQNKKEEMKKREETNEEEKRKGKEDKKSKTEKRSQNRRENRREKSRIYELIWVVGGRGKLRGNGEKEKKRGKRTPGIKPEAFQLLTIAIPPKPIVGHTCMKTKMERKSLTTREAT